MRSVLGGVCVLAGCFLAPTKPAAQHGDGGADAPGDGSGSDIGSCPSWGPWAGETPIAVLDPPTNFADVDAALSPDGKHLVFTRSDGMSPSSLYLASVNGTTFGSAMMIFADAGAATWSPDGSKIYFLASSARAVASFDGSTFAPATGDDQFTGLSPTAEGRVTVTADGTRMYYEVTDGSGETHTYGVSGTLGTHWNGPGVELAELDTGAASTGAPYDQYTPWISSDDLEIFFATSNGNAELRTARRTTRTSAFDAPTRVANIVNDGWRPTVTRDGKLLVFSGVDGRLYYSTRTCP